MAGARAPAPGDSSSAGARRMRLDIAPDAQAPAVARSAARGFCEELAPGDCATLLLLVSELVTNAVLHGGAGRGEAILLSITLSPDRVRVEVTDTGVGLDRQWRARSRAGRQGGYGLELVDRVAGRWGHDRRGGTRVWFELAL